MLSDAKARRLKAGDKPVWTAPCKSSIFFQRRLPAPAKWILRFVSTVTAKRRDMRLETSPVVSIRDARTRAFEARLKLEDGIDPLEEKRNDAEEARKAYLSLKNHHPAA